ncbi:hypothetical protein LEP1GSC072_1522 [Leptospira noguchii str. Bonito]|nr:hypothetical protein LEP1GSC072_1522 [Leptospira noguchii str. Bonito]
MWELLQIQIIQFGFENVGTLTNPDYTVGFENVGTLTNPDYTVGFENVGTLTNPDYTVGFENVGTHTFRKIYRVSNSRLGLKSIKQKHLHCISRFSYIRLRK